MCDDGVSEECPLRQPGDSGRREREDGETGEWCLQDSRQTDREDRTHSLTWSKDGACLALHRDDVTHTGPHCRANYSTHTGPHCRAMDTKHTHSDRHCRTVKEDGGDCYCSRRRHHRFISSASSSSSSTSSGLCSSNVDSMTGAWTGQAKMYPLWPFRVARAPLLVLVMACCVGVVVGRPAMSRYEQAYRSRQSNAVKYLAQFGYLTGPSRETGNLMSADDFSNAIKTLQRMGGIKETGVVDRRTEELMSKPRCGNVDDVTGLGRHQGRSDLGQDRWSSGGGRHGRYKRYTLAPTKWDKTDLTYGFRSYTEDLDKRTVRETIRKAFNLWSNATQLRFTEAVHGEADIMIQFASRYHHDGYPFDGRGMILAHAFFPGVGKEGDTHFDEDENWTVNSTDGVDLFMVAAHEFGHSLGLAHSADAGALMYPWYQGFSGKFVLPRDDTEGIQRLYGPPQGDREFPVRPTVSIVPRVSSGNVTPRRGYNVNPTPRTGAEDQPPDPCTTPFDAITIIRTEVFLFIGKWFWRLDSSKLVHDPVLIHKFWYGLPPEITSIDAALERPGNKQIIFFSGNRYWIYNANRLVTGFPGEGRPITEFGIPDDVKRIDTVFTWGFNQRTYLVSGDMYWKLDENNTFVEYDYPRDISIWQGVPVPLDAAFQYWDGKTYFFQRDSYWKFYDIRMRVDPSYPRHIATDWLQCSDASSKNQPAQHRKDHNGNSAPPATLHSSCPVLWLTLTLFFSWIQLCWPM